MEADFRTDERPIQEIGVGGWTIFALSSGTPPAAVAVVRISGPDAGATLAAVCGATLPAPRRAVLRWVNDPATGERLDRALILWFPGPATATGEDLAELHLHGGRAVIAAVLAMLARRHGLRPAVAGEFTRRAFDNGVIDLPAAEGLADLLAAETEGQRRNALRLAGGALTGAVNGWQESILQAAALVEAALDFADEDDVAVDLAPAYGLAASAAAEMARMLAHPASERLRDGVRVVIAGPPNAGKSTLLNAIVGREAAIVSDIAGTTRDLLEAPVAIDGVPLLLIDSAGLRDGEDPIERIGVMRARRALEGADIILWLAPAATCPVPERAIIVAAKADEAIGPVGNAIRVSARTGAGMDILIAALVERAHAHLPIEDEIALNRRQRDAVAAARACLDHLERDPLLFAEQLRLARATLDRVTGRGGVEDMLDTLFGRFCIGK